MFETLTWSAAAFFVLASVALSVSDVRTRRIPNCVVYPSGAVIVVLYVAAAADMAADAQPGSWERLGAALLGSVIMLMFYLFVAVVTTRALGLGDVKYAGLIGLVLGWHGWQTALLGFALPFCLGGAFATMLLLSGRARRNSSIPFGPHMAIGAGLALITAFMPIRLL
ncbi:prepilin peptidase [Pseudoclavibacter sp. CFCC 13611]|uniref:prepilin peptidase n=1 Tax=Pseudoclavibacter sp. CFCC 13611 TaxID=2615178 RepID=UPI0013015593|nr:A24 family peptidase [Pseudoclavibacter sp. CFCC 13611]KAB1664199.1 prepilin peptidase [Pseudoclavibacter sp. CFCC 13611]